MLKKIFVLLLVNLFIWNNLSYSIEALSLESLIKEAKEKNPEILAAKKRWEASLTRVPQAKSLDSPTVGVTFEKIPKGTLSLGRTMSDDRMLSVSQMFPLFGKLSLKGKIALVESQMYAAEYKGRELEVVKEVKNAYYESFLNFKEIELNQESLVFLEAVANIAQAKYAVGEISQEKLFKLTLEIAELSNRIQNLKRERLAKETRINTLLNKDPENPLGLPQLEEDLSFEADIKNLYALTLQNQPELLIFSYAIERNKHASELAKRNLFPDLMAGVALRGLSAGAIGPWDLMLAFTMPFWFWTKQRYEIKEAIFNLEEAKAAYDAMKNKAFSETKDLVTKVEIAKEKIKLYKTNSMPLLESSINSSTAAFRSKKGDLMMLLDNIRMLIETKMNYYESLVEYNMNLADLERTVGKDLTEVKK